jgi:hypothetical protein
MPREYFVRRELRARPRVVFSSDRTRKENVMRKLIACLAAAAALGVAAPASAQVYFGAGPGGVAVGVGDGWYAHGRHWGHRHRGHWRHGHYRPWRGAYAWGNCRVIRERIVRPSGRVVWRTREVCR